MSERPRLAARLRLALAAFRRHNASRFAAALAFFLLFSIAPTLLILIAVAGSVFGRDVAERAVLERIGGSFGSAAGVAIGPACGRRCGAPLAAWAGARCKRRDALRLGRKEGLQPRARQTARHQLR